MGVVTGLIAGLGLLLVWSSAWTQPEVRRGRFTEHLSELIHASGMRGVSPQLFLWFMVMVGIVAAIVGFALTRIPVVSALAALLAMSLPLVLLQTRARALADKRMEVWPEVVEHLISGVRAGLSLPEALSEVAIKGPEIIRQDFEHFTRDYRATGRFDQSLVTLKMRMADPVADRVIEALRLTRTVGGSELGVLLETLVKFLRQDIRIRGELRARQSWTVGGARVAAAGPWVIVALLSTRQEAAAAYSTASGTAVLIAGAILTAVAYWLMTYLGRLPADVRVLA